MAVLKLVAVLISIFTKQTDGPKLRDYLSNCLTDGMASILFANPAILAAFYTAGNTAYDALALAISNYETNDSTGNGRIMRAKMALAVIWLRSYAAQVQVIANLPANCTTRQDAADNITTSFLTPQKLTSTEKGNPATPLFNAKFVDGVLVINITNGEAYKPTSINFIAIAVPPVTDPATPNPVVSLVQATATISVVSSVAVHMVSRSFSGKAKSAKIAGATLAPSYLLVGYAQNGNKQCSLLSAPILVTIVTLPAPPTV